MKKPETTGQKNTVELAKKALKKEGGWMTRQDLASAIHVESKKTSNNLGKIAESSASANLSTFREYIESLQGFETDERTSDSGRDTVYWRFEE